MINKLNPGLVGKLGSFAGGIIPPNASLEVALQALSDAVGNPQANVSIHQDIFTGDGTTTSFTLSSEPGSANAIEVFVAGIRYTPGVHYTWTAGTTLTFLSVPDADATILVRYGSVLAAGAPPAGIVHQDVFVGDGVKTVFTLSANPGSLANLSVSIGGMLQFPTDDYVWTSGLDITFTEAPPAGQKILVVSMAAYDVSDVQNQLDALGVVVDNQPGPDPAATAAAKAERYQEVVFSKRSYSLPTQIYAGGRVLTGKGTAFLTNPPVALADQVSSTGRWWAMYADKAGDTSIGSGNENTIAVHAVVPVTNAPASYQKNAAYAITRSYDPSDYTNSSSPILRDSVGFQAMGQIMPGNLLGRTWGAHSFAYVFPGADGYATAHEFEMHNYGSDQPSVANKLSKNITHVVAVGGAASSGIKFSARDGGSIRTAIYSDPEILTDKFLHLRDKFSVDASGLVVADGGYRPTTSGTSDLGAISLRFRAVHGNEVMRVTRVTSGTNYNVGADDKLIVVNKGTSSQTFIGLPASPTTGRAIVVVDGKGDAAANPITVIPSSGTVNGAANYVIRTNRESVTLVYDGTEWVVAGTDMTPKRKFTYGAFETAAVVSFQANNAQRVQVNGFVTPGQVATYQDRDSVAVYADNVAPALLQSIAGASFTATTASFSTALNASVVVGMLVDTGHSPKYTGTITAISADRLSFTVSGWFQMGNTAAGQVPAGTSSLFLNPVTKVWAHNANVYLTADSYATRSAGFELGLVNNKGELVYGDGNVGSGTNLIWGYDAVNLGTYTGGVGFIARGNIWRGFVSRGNAQYGFAVENVAQNPAAHFCSEATTGKPFSFRPNGSERYWVGADASVNIGNPSADNGLVITPVNSGMLVRLTAIGVDSDINVQLEAKAGGAARLGATGNKVGFFGGAGVAKPVVSGSRSTTAALTSLISALASLGLITDNTTP